MISLNWCKDYVDLKGEDLNELAIKITKAGVNVEKVINKHINNIVIGKVVSCVDHPNSDHLHICNVDIGEKITQIVCGASNVREGIKVIVALPGAVLPGDYRIEPGIIRGEESNGMICALFELGVEEKTEENYAKGVAEIETDLPLGTDANIYLGTDDVVYELDVHKHRNNDCYYHIGFAYEIASILSKDVKLPESSYTEKEGNINDYVSLNVKTDKCSYYTAKMVKNVVIKESPEFIKKRLLAVGMRPINNVVDISNYVMLEYGQPLHFFDQNKLGDTLIVRKANKDESITTLDGNNRDLNENDIVIADKNKSVCIAGIMGGLNTDVDESTKNILIESAIFDAVSIRNTASRLNLKSEASIRYGKGLNYEYTKEAINRACYLLEKYAEGEVIGGELLYENVNKESKKVEFKTEEIVNLLGLALTDEDVATELKRLMFPYEYREGIFIVTIPNRRLDIEPNVNDIAEEIGRLYGYENLDSTLPRIPIKRGEYIGDVKIRKEASKRLSQLGLNEIKTYTLVSKEAAEKFNYNNSTQIILPNSMSSDKAVIRTTLISSLLNTYDYNAARKVEDISLYEIAKTYDHDYNEDTKIAILMTGNYIQNQWQHNLIKCDFYVLKGIIENLLGYLGFKNRYSFVSDNIPDIHPKMGARILVDGDEIGIIGRVHPSYYKEDIFVAEISLSVLYNKQIKPIKFKPSSKYPEIVKDIAFVMPNDMESKTIQDIIKKSGGRLLSDVSVFDLYQMENSKSIAYKLTFKDEQRTLSDEEVMIAFNKIIEDVTKNTNACLRN